MISPPEDDNFCTIFFYSGVNTYHVNSIVIAFGIMQRRIHRCSFRIALILILLMAAIRLPGQNIPGFWYEDNNMNTAGGFPPDFTEMFTDPAKWENLRDTLSVYMIRGNTLNNIIDQEGEAFIKDYFAPIFTGSDLSLAIDNPPPVSAWPEFYRLLTDNGIRVTHVALQSVLSKSRNGSSPQFDPELENRIQEVKNDIRDYQQTAPDIQYGIIDARPTKGWEYRNAYKRAQDALRSAAIDLDFILLDCPYTYPLQGTKINWTNLKEVENFVIDSLETGYGLIITDNTGGMQSDQAYYDRVMAYTRAYDKTGTVPDYFVLMSWFLHPSKALPEDATAGQYPMTKVGLELFYYLGGFYSPLKTPDVRINAYNEPIVYYSNGRLHIQYDRPIFSVRLYNLMGQPVAAFSGSEIKIMNISSIDPGLYLVLMQVEGHSLCSKIYIHGP